MTGQWKRVADHGAPPDGVTVLWRLGTIDVEPIVAVRNAPRTWMPEYLWLEVPPLPAWDDVAPPPEPPLPEPWKPMASCPREFTCSQGRVTRAVWVRYEDAEDPDHSGSRMWAKGEAVGPGDDDERCGRVAWCEVAAPEWPT